MDLSTFRAASLEDAPRLLDLSNAVDRAWWGHEETDADEIEQRLRLAGDLTRRTRVVDRDGRPVGYAVTFGSQGDTDVLIDPALEATSRRRVEEALLGWLVEVGADHLEAPSHDRGLLAAYARHGFVPSWSSYELERSPTLPLLPAPLPQGVDLRAFDRAAHAGAVHALLYRFWADVAGHRHREIDEWTELFLGHGSFDPRLQVVAWRGERPVGVAICRVYTGDTGWVLQLGVAPEERGQGLGRALLVEATGRLAAGEGVGTVGLSVVARNEQALGLYRSVGFEVTREWVTCRRQRPPVG